jgi:beta-lactamase class A
MKAAALALLALATPAQAFDEARMRAAVQEEEKTLSARVGVAVRSGGGLVFAYKGDERFPILSTHKVFSCAALLARVERGEASLDRRIVILSTDLVPNSPITQNKIAPASMSLAEYCAAAIDYSDNTAANVVLAALGGPQGLTDYFRSLGDTVSRLDRTETDLNEALPGDPRDTTTPAAAAADVDALLLGDALKPMSRERLKQWMREDKVAGPLLRSALPDDWQIADKTGAGARGARGIVGALWPPNRPPVVVTIYLTETPASLDARNAAIARLGVAFKQALDQP